MSKFKEMSGEYKPREKIKLNGVGTLSDVELVAVILQTGSKSESVMQQAQKIIEQFGSLEDLLDASYQELTKIPGIGDAKALKFLTLNEIYLRLKHKPTKDTIKICEPKDIYNMMGHLQEHNQEHLVVCCLNNAGGLISYKTIYIGSISEISIHPREIFNYALQACASSIILVHNHPSGDSTPSGADLESTKRLVEISKVVGIELIDHIIIGCEQFESLRENYGIIF